MYNIVNQLIQRKKKQINFFNSSAVFRCHGHNRHCPDVSWSLLWFVWITMWMEFELNEFVKWLKINGKYCLKSRCFCFLLKGSVGSILEIIFSNDYLAIEFAIILIWFSVLTMCYFRTYPTAGWQQLMFFFGEIYSYRINNKGWKIKF